MNRAENDLTESEAAEAAALLARIQARAPLPAIAERQQQHAEQQLPPPPPPLPSLTATLLSVALIAGVGFGAYYLWTRTRVKPRVTPQEAYDIVASAVDKSV